MGLFDNVSKEDVQTMYEEVRDDNNEISWYISLQYIDYISRFSINQGLLEIRGQGTGRRRKR